MPHNPHLPGRTLMGKQFRPRKLNAAQVRRMRTLMRWKQLWDEQPDRMEQIRKAATKIAADKRHRRNLALRDILTSWPETLSPDEFRQQIAILAPNLNPKSVVNRVRRLGYLTFDPARLAWINHTRHSVDKQGDNVNMSKLE